MQKTAAPNGRDRTQPLSSIPRAEVQLWRLSSVVAGEERRGSRQVLGGAPHDAGPGQGLESIGGAERRGPRVCLTVQADRGGDLLQTVAQGDPKLPDRPKNILESVIGTLGTRQREGPSAVQPPTSSKPG